MFNLFFWMISSVFMFFLASVLVGVVGIILIISSKKTDKIRRLAAINGEKKAYELMDRFGGHDRLENIVIGSFDKINKMAEVDALIHGKGCLLSIEIKNWSGIIHPDANKEFWLVEQKNGKKIYRRNPLLQSKRHASIINEYYPNITIIPMVLILGWNEFKGELPEGLLTYKTVGKISKLLKNTNDKEIISNARKIWDNIVIDEFDPRSEKRKETYLNYVRKKHREPRNWISAFVASGCLLFMVILLSYHIMCLDIY